MKQLIKKLINKCGYDISRIHKNHFTISGIEYLVGRCTVGETPQGEMTAKAAIRMIKERQLKELTILDICCGVGIIGLTVFSTLRKAAIAKEVVFADINTFNIESLLKTLTINNLAQLLGTTIRCYLTNGLNHIPSDEKFDLIISNPPHYFDQSFSKQDVPMSPKTLAKYDPGWNFHKSFYRECHNYLTDGGEVWFLENGSASNEKDFLPYIEDNEHLKYIRKVEEPLDPTFFWMITGCTT